MRKSYKLVAGSIVALSGTGLFVYGLEKVAAESAFKQGLQFKVEEIADIDEDGSLSVDEMATVYRTIEENPAQRLRKGFYLSVKQSQKYLKAKGRFDSQTDAEYILFQKHPSFIKAVAEGKHVNYPSF